MQDILGNNTEEKVNEFIKQLDANPLLGPKPISGIGFSINSISDVIGCTDEIARELFNRPSPFYYDEFDQVYVIVKDVETSEDIKIYICSDIQDPSYPISLDAIGKNLPELTYDIECGGYPSRQSEAVSLYKILIINSFQEGNYSSEIKQILANYDFNRWCTKDGNYEFVKLLQKIQEDADSVTKIILMCANNKLVADRIKKSTSYKGILQEEDAEKLRLLAEEDARINFSFNKKFGAAKSSKEKVFIGEDLANARREMLNAPYVTPELVVLFKIYDLNQNAVPGRAKRIIRNSASLYVSKLAEEKAFKDSSSASDFKKKIITRAQKLFLSRMKEIRYKLWASRTVDFDLDTLIPKY